MTVPPVNDTEKFSDHSCVDSTRKFLASLQLYIYILLLSHTWIGTRRLSGTSGSFKDNLSELSSSSHSNHLAPSSEEPHWNLVLTHAQTSTHLSEGKRSPTHVEPQEQSDGEEALMWKSPYNLKLRYQELYMYVFTAPKPAAASTSLHFVFSMGNHQKFAAFSRLVCHRDADMISRSLSTSSGLLQTISIDQAIDASSDYPSTRHSTPQSSYGLGRLGRPSPFMWVRREHLTSRPLRDERNAGLDTPDVAGYYQRSHPSFILIYI